tara:strand:+ start:792 stop:1106 length:315 start_codon:yes stop_codon:yes gene_type:complete
MLIYVDIDDTICTYEGERHYPSAVPIVKNIEKINKLYDEGNTIVYWTARGGTTGIDWTELTHKQIHEWGAKHHEIKMWKPPYDLFICDKAINTDNFFREETKND